MQATFKPIVHLHRQRKDKNYSVIIRIGFRSKYAYLETDLSVSNSDLKRNGDIKNQIVIDKCNIIIKEYRKIANSLPDINTLDVSMIKSAIVGRNAVKKALNFVELFEEYLEDNKASPSISIYKTTYNHLVKFAGKSLLIDAITPNYLKKFEESLSMGSRGINLYLSNIRKVYNWIMDEYEHKGYNFYYPFRKYKIPNAKYSAATSLTKEQLKEIISIELKGLRANRARDIFVISLLSLGTNAKDLYMLEKISDRIEYNRSKTKKKRDDNAFISIKVEPELIHYLEKYKGKERALAFSEWYANPPKLNESIYLGLRQVVKQINDNGKTTIEHLEYYDARRSIASVMRNKLKISKDDIAKCLNHIDVNNKITDIYIEKDFSILDQCNRKFIDWLFNQQ